MNPKGKYTYDYPRPMVTADALVFSLTSGRPKVLLVKRKYEPFKGQWCVPGGFIGIDEVLAVAAARELAEETNLTGVSLQQLHTFGKPGRDPRGRQITIVFFGFADETTADIRPGDDAAEAAWFDLESPPPDMAFDHNDVLALARNRLEQLNTDK